MNISDEVIATTRRTWAPAAEQDAELPPMPRDEFGSFLNLLLQAERAGAKLLSAYLDELPLDSFKWKSIRAVQLDEAHNCAVLALPRVPQSARTALQEMHDSHVVNIGHCEALF